MTWLGYRKQEFFFEALSCSAAPRSFLIFPTPLPIRRLCERL